MLKKTIPFILIFIVHLASSAQVPVLTSSTNYLAGDTHTQYLMSQTDTFYISSSGPLQTWILGDDFIVGEASEYYTVCSADVYCDSFPGTSVCGQGLWFGSSRFYNETSGALSVDGEYDSVLTVYNNYMDVLRYPFTYNSTFIDTFAAEYTKDSIAYYRYGTISVTGDAYGTMITGLSDTFNNTIRVHSIKNYFDSSAGLGVVYTYFEESYAWYVPDYREAFVTQISKITNGVRSHMSYFNNQRKITTSVAYNTMQEETEVYPDPVNTLITIKSPNINKVSITNMFGQIVYCKSQIMNYQQFQVDVSVWPAGMYLIKINDYLLRNFIKR